VRSSNFSGFAKYPNHAFPEKQEFLIYHKKSEHYGCSAAFIRAFYEFKINIFYINS
jgi:hypothetical protein